jgi:dTDP-glucose 4,6-dehydratase
MDVRKMESETGWKPLENFETGLRKTVEWYMTHKLGLRA